MSEEEIMNIITNMKIVNGKIQNETPIDVGMAIQGLLDLYNKEKEKNKKLKKQMGKDLDVVYIKGVYDERNKWKNKIKELAKKYEYAAIGYDSSEATFKQSQDIGRYEAYCNLLNKEEK